MKRVIVDEEGGFIVDKTPILKASIKSHNDNEDKSKASIRRFSRKVSKSLDLKRDRESKRIYNFSRQIKYFNIAIEMFENHSEKLKHLNHSILTSVQPEPKKIEDREELHNDLEESIPLFLSELEKIYLRNNKLKLQEGETAYVRIRQGQYSLLATRISTAIMQHTLNQIDYQEKCDSRASTQFKLVSELTKIPSEHVTSLLNQNSPVDAYRRDKINKNILARHALAEVESLRKESNNVDESNLNLSEPIIEAMQLMSKKRENDVSNSIQYQVDHVSEYIPDERTESQLTSTYQKPFKILSNVLINQKYLIAIGTLFFGILFILASLYLLIVI